MKKISVINYKGGTGKTCTVINIAHGLVLKGKKVLVIDTDPQGSAGYHLGVDPKHTLYDIVMGNKTPEQCIEKSRQNIDIICSNERMFPASIVLSSRKNKEKIFLEKFDSLTGYDFVLVDCGPSMSLFSQNALVFSDELWVPVTMEYLSLVGVKQLLNNIKIINRIFRRNVKISKVIPTLFDKRNNKSKEILSSLERVFPGLITSPVRVNVAVSEAAGYRQTVFEYDPESNGAEDYLKLVKEVLEYDK